MAGQTNVNWEHFLYCAGIGDVQTIKSYAALFEASKIDESQFDDLTKEHLSQIGIESLGHKMKILKHLRRVSIKDVPMVGNYIVRELLGQGTNHTVRLGVHRYTGEVVALKILGQKYWNNEKPEYWWQNPTLHERNMLDLCVANPHVVRKIDACFDVEYKSPEGTSWTTHVLVLECALTSIYDVIYFTGPFDEYISRAWFSQCIEGLQQCHEDGVMHRDLKPEQLLLTEKMELKISDFGFGEHLEKSDLPGNKRKRTNSALVGTKKYMAPEVYSLWMLQQHNSLTHTDWYDVVSADVWGCGIILLFLLTGRDPFLNPCPEDENFCRLRDKKYDEFWTYICPEGVELSSNVKELIVNILNTDSKKRYKLKDIKDHPWMKEEMADAETLYRDGKNRYQQMVHVACTPPVTCTSTNTCTTPPLTTTVTTIPDIITSTKITKTTTPVVTTTLTTPTTSDNSTLPTTGPTTPPRKNNSRTAIIGFVVAATVAVIVMLLIRKSKNNNSTDDDDSGGGSSSSRRIS